MNAEHHETTAMARHIRSPWTHDPICGANSKIALMNRAGVEKIYCDLVLGDGRHPCLDCVRQLAWTLSDGAVGGKVA